MENLLEGQMMLGIGDKVFNSLKFVKTTKQTDEFYDSLVEEGSEFSRMRYKSCVRAEHNEEIHIKLSVAIVLKFIALGFLSIAILITFANVGTLVAGVTLGISLVTMLLSSFFKNKAKEQEEAGEDGCDMLVDMFFDL